MTATRGRGLSALAAIGVVLALAGSGGGEQPAAGPEAKPAAPPEQLRLIEGLLRLRGKDYAAARDAIVGTVAEQQLVEVREAAKDPLVALVCDGLLWRQRNPKTAALLDKHGQNPCLAGTFSPPGATGQELWGDHGPVVTRISCFGPEAFPALAEHLLYESRPLFYRLDLIETLVELRDARVVGVLLALAARADEEPRVRAAAVWRLEKCLSGVPALSMPYAVGKNPLGVGPSVIAELAGLAKPVQLAGLEVRDPQRAGALKALAGTLAADKDERVRALAARALRGGDATSVPALAAAVAGDESPWVRTWCADTLKRLGTPEAAKALEAARAAEKHAEVLAVLEGREAAALPEQGLPGKSILRNRQ